MKVTFNFEQNSVLLTPQSPADATALVLLHNALPETGPTPSFFHIDKTMTIESLQIYEPKK